MPQDQDNPKKPDAAERRAAAWVEQAIRELASAPYMALSVRRPTLPREWAELTRDDGAPVDDPDVILVRGLWCPGVAVHPENLCAEDKLSVLLACLLVQLQVALDPAKSGRLGDAWSQEESAAILGARESCGGLYRLLQAKSVDRRLVAPLAEHNPA